LNVVAASKGYFNGFEKVTTPASDIVIELTPVPADDDAAYEITGPRPGPTRGYTTSTTVPGRPAGSGASCTLAIRHSPHRIRNPNVGSALSRRLG
jgi:hypothetical protein